MNASDVLTYALVTTATIYLLAVACDAGAACTAGALWLRRQRVLGVAVLRSLGPLPLLNAAWLVATTGLLMGAFPAELSAVHADAGPAVLVVVVSAVTLLIVLMLHALMAVVGAPATLVASAAGGLLLVATAWLTWAGGRYEVPVRLAGAGSQVVLSVALGCAWSQTRLRRPSATSDMAALERFGWLNCLGALALTCVLAVCGLVGQPHAESALRSSLPLLVPVVLVIGCFARRLRSMCILAAWSMTVLPALGRWTDHLRSPGPELASTNVLAVAAATLIPLLIAGQVATWAATGLNGVSARLRSSSTKKQRQ